MTTTPIWTSKDGQSHLYHAEAVGVMAQFDAAAPKTADQEELLP